MRCFALISLALYTVVVEFFILFTVEVGIKDGFVIGKYIPGDSITLNIHKTLLSI
jgi:hypothetical protein